MHLSKIVMIPLAIALFSLRLMAQSEPKPEASPCAQAEFHQFDYWIGTWSVAGTNQKKSADVTVAPILSHCALSEHWATVQADRGHDGYGVSTFNQATQNWEYFWVASNGYTSFWTGHFSENAMNFVAAQPSPGAAPLRQWVMKLLPDGRIEETATSSQDDGKTWKIQYTLYWTRVNP
jgi:hypothetical protein